MNFFLHDNRITVDYDFKNQYKLAYYLLKGIILCKKLPNKIRITAKGFHVIFSGIEIPEDKRYVLRKRLADDFNRIRLDMVSFKRTQQVLFSEKTVTYFNTVIGELFWRLGFKPPVNFKVCPICHKRKVLKSMKFWTQEKRAIEVHHADGRICGFNLPERKTPPMLNLFKRMGVEIET